MFDFFKLEYIKFILSHIHKNFSCRISTQSDDYIFFYFFLQFTKYNVNIPNFWESKRMHSTQYFEHKMLTLATDRSHTILFIFGDPQHTRSPPAQVQDLDSFSWLLYMYIACKNLLKRIERLWMSRGALNEYSLKK